MTAKLDKFTAARIRRFNATGMAVQKALPFERLRFESRPQMMMRLPPGLSMARKRVSAQQHAS